VGVVLHGLGHEGRFGGEAGKLRGTGRGVVGVSSPATERKCGIYRGEARFPRAGGAKPLRQSAERE
jgi:hypothetical protein